jgi:hypothetical protein
MFDVLDSVLDQVTDDNWCPVLRGWKTDLKKLPSEGALAGLYTEGYHLETVKGVVYIFLVGD